jgi:hypothetical protein
MPVWLCLLCVTRDKGQVANDEMRERLLFLENRLKDKKNPLNKSDRVVAIYSLAVHNPWNEEYARLLGHIIVPLRSRHKDIAHALVLGRKATRDQTGNPDITEDKQSPLQRHVTKAVKFFLQQRMMPEKKVNEFLGDINLVGHKLNEPVRDDYLHGLNVIYQTARIAEISTKETPARKTFAEKLDNFKDKAMEIFGIDGMTARGHAHERDVRKSLPNLML